MRVPVLAALLTLTSCAEFEAWRQRDAIYEAQKRADERDEWLEKHGIQQLSSNPTCEERCLFNAEVCVAESIESYSDGWGRTPMQRLAGAATRRDFCGSTRDNCLMTCVVRAQHAESRRPRAAIRTSAPPTTPAENPPTWVPQEAVTSDAQTQQAYDAHMRSRQRHNPDAPIHSMGDDMPVTEVQPQSE